MPGPLGIAAAAAWLRTWWPGAAAAVGVVVAWAVGGIQLLAGGAVPVALVALIAVGVRAETRYQASIERAIDVCDHLEEGG